MYIFATEIVAECGEEVQKAHPHFVRPPDRSKKAKEWCLDKLRRRCAKKYAAEWTQDKLTDSALMHLIAQKLKRYRLKKKASCVTSGSSSALSEHKQPIAFLQKKLSLACEVCGIRTESLTVQQIAQHLVPCFNGKMRADGLFEKAVLANFGFFNHLVSNPVFSESSRTDSGQLQTDHIKIVSVEALSEEEWATFETETKETSNQKFSYFGCFCCREGFLSLGDVFQHVKVVHQLQLFSNAFKQVVERSHILEQIKVECPYCRFLVSVHVFGSHLLAKSCDTCCARLPCQKLVQVHWQYGCDC